MEDSKKDRGGQIRSRTPGREWDAVWARGGIVSMVNRKNNVIEANIVTKRGINFLGITT